MPVYQPAAYVPQRSISIGQLARRVPPVPVKRTHSGVDVNTASSQDAVAV